MTCPLCRQATDWDGNPWRPFCSERCQLTDLGTWAAEAYRVPGPELGKDLSPRDGLEADDGMVRHNQGRTRNPSVG